MSVLDEIRARLPDIGADKTMVLEAPKIDVPEVTNFLKEGLKVDTLTVSSASLDKAEGFIAIRGVATILEYPELRVCLTFRIEDEALSILLQGTLPASSEPLRLPLLNWIQLEGLGLSLAQSGSYGVLNSAFHGNILVDSRERISISLSPSGGQGWQLEAAQDHDVAIGDISHLTSLLNGNSVKTFMPDTPDKSFDVLKDIKLGHISAFFNIEQKKVLYFTIQIRVSNGWPIVEDKIGIKEDSLRLILTLVNPTEPDSRQLIGIARGTIVLGKTDVPVFVQGNFGSGPSAWVVGLDPETDGLTLPSFSDLLGLAGGKGFLDSLPKGFSDLPQIQIDTLLVTFDPTNKTLNEIDFAIQTKSPWRVVDKYFVVTNIYVALVITDLIGGSTPATQGLIRCTFNLDDVSVELSASVNQPVRAGWLFEGSTAKLAVDRLIAYIANTFGVKDLPGFITGITLENLAVSYDTGSKQFTFAATGNIPVGEKTLRIQVEIALTRVLTPTGDSFTKDLSGTIEIGTAKFALDFSSGSSNTSFKANWVKKDGESLDVADIAGALPDLQSLLSPPKVASLELSFGVDNNVKRLTLACTLENGTKAAFLLAEDTEKTPPEWIAALGVKVPKISTKSLGALGSVLQPYSIALDKLLVVAASANAPEGELLTLDGGYEFTEGFLLKGALEFGGTSYSYPFECRLGGDQKPKELPGPGPGATTPSISTVALSSSPESGERAAAPEAQEAKNNVAVGRTIGPVTFRQARLESRDERVYLLLDASLGSGGFALDLIGFNLNFPMSLLKDPTPAAIVQEIKVGLDGLSIAYSNPPLTISGGLARTTAESPYVGDVYRGHLLIKAQTFQITVLGSYGTIEAQDRAGTTISTPSLFLYGTYAGVLGGPGVFFVTGLALGGGYNTRLALPKIEDVADFPLVQAVTDPEKFAQNQSEGIEKLSKAIEPSYGDYWLAVGVKFDSFKMADSFALFSVSFGTRLQFALLGLTKLTMPRGVERDKAAIYAELAIRAVLDPEAGVFSIEGRLTQRSFVLAKELHLTGGFAFFVWFGKAREAGDFVISLGGYHKDFVSPPHYPLVPRVGIHGQIGRLAVTGEAYLALTPSCVMAGQRLEAVFETDIILVTFVAYADFLIAWAPFHYDARIGIGIAVTFQQLRSFKLELAARLHIWGPPFGGTAEVVLWIISFTIEFGDHSGAQPALLDWGEFQKAFLPAADSNGNGDGLSTIRITEGLVREVKRENENVTYRIVNPHELMIETESVVPCSEVAVGAISKPGAAKIGIRPMGATTLESSHVVSIKRNDVSPDKSSFDAKFKPVQWTRKNYPEALWSNTAATGKPDAGMVEGVPSGVVLRVQPIAPAHCLGPFLTEKFERELIPRGIPWSAAAPSPGAIKQEFSGVSATSPVRDRIRDVLKHVAAPGKTGWNEITLTNTSANPSGQFEAPPTCAALGQSL